MGSPNEANDEKSKADAVQFVMDMQYVFRDKVEKRDEFVEVLNDLRNRRIDTVEAVSRANQLFKGHDSLILGFNAYLSKLSSGYEIKPCENEPTVLELSVDFIYKGKWCQLVPVEHEE